MKNLSKKNITISNFLPLFFAFTVAIMYATACGDGAKSEKDAVAEGQESFQSYCTLCHGENADGKGNMASLLETPPMNLTTIAQRRGGNFPDAEIAKIIAGVEDVPGHSSGDMPAWYETFKKAEGINSDKEVQEKIDNIVAYLKTIQK
jgi:mono/diheme cytochrome c family protein